MTPTQAQQPFIQQPAAQFQQPAQQPVTQSPQAQQLLEKMHGIQAPPPVDWWPPAPGWWVLAALLVIGTAASMVWLRRRRARDAYRREALQRVADLKQWEGETLVQQANILLKRTALGAYAGEQNHINRAFGPAWVDWLNGCCKQPAFTGTAAADLAGGGYQATPEHDREALIAAVNRWIRTHRRGVRHRV